VGAGPQAYDIVTSELTLLEVLIGPIKRGNVSLQRGFKQLLLGSSQVRTVPISRSVLEHAAALRAASGLKTPDARHVATAPSEGCVRFVTNDAGLRGAPNLHVTVLHDLVTP
jgi:predicted nucleic acid-binding protein